MTVCGYYALALIGETAIYKHRNQIERCFNRLKHFRRFATRYDQRTIHSSGFVHLAAAVIWPP